MDYFLARYYSSAQGRFTSPDEILVGQDPAAPQSWNLYAYTQNNPLNAIDPDGRETCFFDKDGNRVGCIGEKGVSITETELIVNGNKYNLEGLNAVVSVQAPQYTPAASGFAGFINGLTFPLELFSRAILGEDRAQAKILRDAQRDNPVAGTLGEIGGSLALGGVAGRLAGAAAGGTTGLGLTRTIGNNLKNVRPIQTGRLAGYLRGNTEMRGGAEGAREVFRSLVGRQPAGSFDRAVLANKEVVFRATSGSGPSKVEVVDHAQRFLEKISFK